MTAFTETRPARPGTVPIVVLAGVIPALATVAGFLVQRSWASTLPADLVTHWGPSGEPNGWMSPLAFALFSLGFTLGMIALFVVLTVQAYRSGAGRGTIVSASTLGALLGVGLTVAMAMTTYAQRVGVELQTATLSWTWSIIAALYVIAVAVLTARIRPLPPKAAESVVPVDPIALEPGERASWFARAGMTTGAVIAILVLGVGLLVFVSVMSFAAGALVFWPLLITVLVLLVLVTTLTWRVRVDADGLRVRALLGLPKFQYALEDITAVRVVEVRALRDFGGWGIRSGRTGAFGVVTRSGRALEIDRATGGRFLVTVDDAETGARLLEALLRERR